MFKCFWYKYGAWLVIAIFVIGIFTLAILTGKSNHPSQPNNPSPNPSPPSHHQGDSNPPKLVWGIDTASKVDSKMYKCVTENYGKPVVVGRYLGDNSNASTGITKDEAKYLHSKGVKILLIHNRLTSATGKEKGDAEANEALKLVSAIDVPKGKYIVVDIEQKTPVDSDFLIEWTKKISDGGYKPMVYGNFDNDNLAKVYQIASKKSTTVKDKLLIWANQPIKGKTSKKNAPNSFKANSPNQSKTLVWQYGLSGGDKCNIDTDIIKGKTLDNLW